MGATSFANVVVALAIEDTIKTVRSSRILPPRIGNVRCMVFNQQLPFCFPMHLFYVEPSIHVWSDSEMPKKLRPPKPKATCTVARRGRLPALGGGGSHRV